MWLVCAEVVCAVLIVVDAGSHKAMCSSHRNASKVTCADCGREGCVRVTVAFGALVAFMLSDTDLFAYAQASPPGR